MGKAVCSVEGRRVMINPSTGYNVLVVGWHETWLNHLILTHLSPFIYETFLSLIFPLNGICVIIAVENRIPMQLSFSQQSRKVKTNLRRIIFHSRGVLMQRIPVIILNTRHSLAASTSYKKLDLLFDCLIIIHVYVT